MSLSAKQLQRCILLGYQLATFFEFEDQHKELETPELQRQLQRLTADYDIPKLPKENPFPSDWLLRPELVKAIKEFRKLFDKIPASADSAESSQLPDPTPQPPPIRPRQTQAQSHSSPVTPTPFISRPPSPHSTSEELTDLSLEFGRSGSPDRSPHFEFSPQTLQDPPPPPRDPMENTRPFAMSEAQIAAIVTDAVTRALARNADEVRTIVDDVVTTRRDELRGPAGRDGHDAPQGNSHWKSDDVGYFTPDSSSDVHVRTTKGTTYYLNVYAFINQLKALVPLKSEEVVRANLPSCLREAAARWYSAELSDEERQDLSVRSLQLGWYATLERRFKPRPTEALTKVMSPSSVYSWRDVRAGRSVTEWAQNMLRDAQAADMTGTTTLLRLVWTRLEPALQRDIREPTAATTISQFMADLDQRYGQWYEMSKRARPRQTQPQPARYQAYVESES